MRKRVFRNLPETLLRESSAGLAGVDRRIFDSRRNKSFDPFCAFGACAAMDVALGPRA